jgi:hypothetical protein
MIAKGSWYSTNDINIREILILTTGIKIGPIRNNDTTGGVIYIFSNFR